ncbi:MAG: YkgJ family cysteine cluster protein [Candidatus Bathyarchaeota archaeon]|nr:YkgJ family cysteine cluster protein [Candidatus Bathyarchaeota archaeon]MDH5745750.1 YkgJ family cysteine cluster protein [Candidatus Bathyarchaeota archaeon]
MSFEYPKHVRFRCVRCALCYGDTEDRVRSILLLKTEADRISKRTLIGLDNFAEKIEGFDPYIYQIRKIEDGKCVFLKDNSCSIYKMRPLICRFYPFQLKNLRNSRYAFTYTDECPGIGKGPRLKKAFFERLFEKFIELMKENVPHA